MKLRFITNTRESQFNNQGNPDPLLLEIEVEGNEIRIDIGTDSQIENFKSTCIYLSRIDAKELGKWLYASQI